MSRDSFRLLPSGPLSSSARASSARRQSCHQAYHISTLRRHPELRSLSSKQQSSPRPHHPNGASHEPRVLTTALLFPTCTSSLRATKCSTFMELLKQGGVSSVSTNAVSHSGLPARNFQQAAEPHSAEILKK